MRAVEITVGCVDADLADQIVHAIHNMFICCGKEAEIPHRAEQIVRPLPSDQIVRVQELGDLKVRITLS